MLWRVTVLWLCYAFRLEERLYGESKGGDWITGTIPVDKTMCSPEGGYAYFKGVLT